MVDRNDLKLTLSGRAPMEIIEAPQVIPMEVRHFFRGALLAQHVGQTLAANFLLRTVIEQWARHALTKAGTPPQSGMKADEVLEAYTQLHSLAFRSTFESMPALYGALSADIHSAAGAPELFDRAIQEIERHFEARRLFKL